MPIGPPPVGEHALGEHDHITRLLLTVDDEVSEAVSLDPRHRLTSNVPPGGGDRPRALYQAVKRLHDERLRQKS